MFIDDPTRVHHILDSARESMQFAAGKARADLDSDRLLALALAKCDTVGEAAYKVSRNYPDSNPQNDWAELITFRNALVHDYYLFDLDAIWNAIEDEIPGLIVELEKLVVP